MKQKILLSIFLLSFTFAFAQIEEIKEVDDMFDKKTEEIKELNRRPKKHLPLLSELNLKRIAEYNKIIDRYYAKDSSAEGLTGFAAIQKGFETIDKIKAAQQSDKAEGSTIVKEQISETIEKQVGYTKGGIGGFRNDFAKLLNLENLPYHYNLQDVRLKTVLTFIVDVNGNIRNVNAEGDNEELSTLAKIALYKTAGNWIPAESDGKKINNVFRFPAVIN